MFPEDTVLFATLEKNGNKVNIPLVCQQCGKCCRKLSHVLFDAYKEEINVEGIDHIKDFLGLRYYEVVEHLRHQIGEGVLIVNPCPFFKNDGCEVYPARPRSCRQFPLGIRTSIVLLQRGLKRDSSIWEEKSATYRRSGKK